MKEYKYLYEVKRDFPVGSRVRYSTWGLNSLKREQCEGVVSGHARKYLGLNITWDGRKTAYGYHVKHIERIP